MCDYIRVRLFEDDVRRPELLRQYRLVIPDERLARWCESALGSGLVRASWTAGHLSKVLGGVLADGRRVVVKIRPWEERLIGCVSVQQAVAAAGYPCPAPLAGPDQVEGWAVSAEGELPSGEQRPDLGGPAFAALLFELMSVAPKVTEVPSLSPSPPWTAWDHTFGGLWPERDDAGRDLNRFSGPAWLDEAADRVRRKLAVLDAPLRVGHGDWESQNIRWNGDSPLAVHDWDSVIAQPEAAIVGLAAAVWPANGWPPGAATIEQSAEFVEAYQASAGNWTARDESMAWAAGLWVRLFNAKKAAVAGGGSEVDGLEVEIGERLRLAEATAR